MTTTEYDDPYAKEVFQKMRLLLSDVIFGFDLERIGVCRDFDADELVLKLHFKQVPRRLL